MSDKLYDVRIVALNRDYPRQPLATVLQWAIEGRLRADDLITPSGKSNWTQIRTVPMLAARLPRRAPVERPIMAEFAVDEIDEEALEAELDGGSSWLPPRPKRAAEEAEMDMTPMIDVTFQLLIFFMLTNQLANPAPLAVPEAKHGRGVSPEGTQMVLIDEAGRYFLGLTIAEENSVASLDALVQAVQTNAQASPQPLDVIIDADKTAKYLNIRPVVERLGGVPNVGRIMLGVEEARN
ncbi:MAG: biopolymer transporter ExbD [Planctomycetes bacterium]|nr:biopolymer transporter ExbD [Planctomycetota bacterium]